MATGMGETLHRCPRNAESFRIKQRAFRLVPPDGGLVVFGFDCSTHFGSTVISVLLTSSGIYNFTGSSILSLCVAQDVVSAIIDSKGTINRQCRSVRTVPFRQLADRPIGPNRLGDRQTDTQKYRQTDLFATSRY